ncbi:MAG: superoxide dismutase [Candidatus Dependentiae bacterium]|nr:superoxide dismutase [Candidatus Dependentiae bacterium]
MRSLFSHIAVGLLTVFAMLFFFSVIQKRESKSIDTSVAITSAVATPETSETTKTTPSQTTVTSRTYQPRTFNFSDVQGLTKSQLEQHEKLYQGYVKKRNEIAKGLQTVSKDEVAASYAPLRSLKVAETFALNGALLHELYFENISGTNPKMGAQTEALLIKNFGSIDAFKKDLFAVAGCARGWVMTGFSILDGTIENYLLDAHNETVPVLVIPLLMVDTYEHAYMIDFGINRAEYLKVIWNNINWNIVEERINKWASKF